MVGVVGARMFSVLHVGFSNCLPSDFPRYPQATVSSIVVTDSRGDCTMQYRTRDSGSAVETFYETKLNQGDWVVTRIDERAGMIVFARSSRPRTTGYVKVLSFPGQQTQFQIQIRVR